MRRVLTFISSLTLVMMSISCGNTALTTETSNNDMVTTIEEITSTTETSAITTTSYNNESILDNEGYATDVVIRQFTMADQLQQPQKYFQAYYSHVKYTPVTRTLTLTVNIVDIDFQGAEYILVGRYKDDFSEERKHFIFGKSAGSLTYTFDNVDLSRIYEVLIAKTDDDDLNPSQTLYSVCTLELSDPYADDRYEVYNTVSTDNTVEYLNYDETPYIDLDIEYSDENQVITRLAIGLFSNYDKTLIEERYIDVDDSNYDQGMILIDNLIFSNLSPSQEYVLQIYATGNDGVDDFELITLNSFLVVAPTYENSNIRDSFFNLYATITYSEIIDNNAVFYYTAINDGSYVYSDTQEPVTIMVRVMAGNIDNNTYEYEYDEVFSLDLQSNTILIPIEYAQQGAYIRIYDERNELEFCEYIVNPGIVSFNAFISIYTDLRFEIPDDSNVENIVSLNVRLYDSNDQLVSEFLYLDTTQGQFAWELPTGIGSFSGWYLVVDYESDSIIGILSHQQIIELH